MIRPLYKTLIVIWSEYDASDAELTDLAFQATEGNAYCSVYKSVQIPDPNSDPHWDGTEFFDREEDE